MGTLHNGLYCIHDFRYVSKPVPSLVIRSWRARCFFIKYLQPNAVGLSKMLKTVFLVVVVPGGNRHPEISKKILVASISLEVLTVTRSRRQ